VAEVKWEIRIADSVLKDLLDFPSSVFQSFQRKALPRLRDDPTRHDGTTCKQINRARSLWQLRLGDYRLWYTIHGRSVTICGLANRRDWHAKSATLRESPERLVSLEESAPRFTPEDLHDDIAPAHAAGAADQSSPCPAGERLPPNYADALEKLALDAGERARLLGCTTVDELFACGVSEHSLGKLIDTLYPEIAASSNSPRRVVTDEELSDFVSGKKSLQALWLAVDGEQKGLLDTVTGRGPRGPWLLKGGPGTGKSTVIAYAAAEAVQPRQMPLEGTPPRVLITTFTRSLSVVAEALISQLVTADRLSNVTVRHIDRIARELCKKSGRSAEALNDAELQRLVSTEAASPELRSRLRMLGAEFLVDEIEWVIVGRGLRDLASYMKADRSGRGRPLSEAQRTAIWDLHERVSDRLVGRERTTWARIEEAAARVAEASYDYVFVDEAQDLKPTAIRLCRSLCKSPEGLLIAIDANQSIYGRGLSWRKVDETLQFRGRSHILKRGYRTTHEIAAAISVITATMGERDLDTATPAPAFHGEPPVFVRAHSESDEHAILWRFLVKQADRIGVALDTCAILARTTAQGRALEKSLQKFGSVRFSPSRGLRLEPGVVTITTVHAAKGLEFPVVAVPGVVRDWWPYADESDEDGAARLDQEKRLLVVACSRALRRLLVSTVAGQESRLIEPLSAPQWRVYDEPLVH
jgi:mRNA-degrading endonuclease RelE of RelBE toxin-antitoxin system